MTLTIDPQQDPQVQKQMAVEQDSIDLGVERYRKNLAKGGDDSTMVGMSLLRRAVEPTKAAIEAYIEKIKSGRADRLGGTIAFLEQFDTDVLALLTCRTVIHSLSMRPRLQTVVDALGKALEEQTNIDHLETENPKLFRKFQQKLKEHGPGKRACLIKAQGAYAGLRWISWGLQDRRRVGLSLIHMFVEATGLVRITEFATGKPGQTMSSIVACEETAEWLSRQHELASALSPVYMPMVCKPLPWTSPFGGGYLNSKLRTPLIRGTNRNFLEELRHLPMDMEYRAINALQDTRWAINKGILSVMQEAWLERRISIGGLPPFDNLEMPPRTFTDEEAAAKAPAFIQWKRRAAEVYEANLKRLPGQRSGVAFLIMMANKFAEEEAIHFVHMMDWRGRKYAVSSYLNPQGNDLSKSLLRFADAVPLGSNGQYWLAVHGANCFGVDKVSFDERVQWVMDNEEAILESALKPLDGTQWWAQADAPFQFLAFCREWLALNMHLGRGLSAESFASDIPVSWDGSCNGLQNFAAMVRDPVGGAAVNLVPGDRPSDVYSMVAQRAQALIDEKAAEGDEVATRWVGKMSRKLAKRNTMTVPYGVSQFGMRDQLMSEYRQDKAKAEDAGGKLGYEVGPEDATFLAAANYNAIGQVVQSAHAVMGWLQKVARVAAEGGLPVHWVTPSGFHVLQSYRNTFGKRMDVVVLGQRYQLMFNVEGTELDKRKQASGISPNFVHSLDAAHLTRTVNYCLDAGITDFAMVHDSYGTHAGNADALSMLLRRAFVDQYSGAVLEDFRKQIEQQLPEKLVKKLPPTPPMGTLDLEGVMTSGYFFA